MISSHLHYRMRKLSKIGRIPWPQKSLRKQFLLPPFGHYFKFTRICRFLYAEYKFTCCHSHKPAVFCILRSNINFFYSKISAILFRKLHVIYSYCTSSGLLAGGLHAVLRIFYHPSEENIQK